MTKDYVVSSFRLSPEHICALKGLDILAQGIALGNEEIDIQAMKGRDIAKLRMLPPLMG
jgi:hypothetical protein